MSLSIIIIIIKSGNFKSLQFFKSLTLLKKKEFLFLANLEEIEVSMKFALTSDTKELK